MLPLPEVGGTLPPIINQTVLNEWALSFSETDLLLPFNSTDTVPALRKVVYRVFFNWYPPKVKVWKT